MDNKVTKYIGSKQRYYLYRRNGRVGPADAAVTARLRVAGAVLIGQTHTHEYAYGVLTPTTHNPWDLSRTPGGSSGGSSKVVRVLMVNNPQQVELQK